MAAITDMNEEIDVRPVLPTVRVPSLVPAPRAGVPARGQPLHGRAPARCADRRGAGCRPPPVGGRPDGGARSRSNCSSAACSHQPPSNPGPAADDRARRGPAGVRAATAGIGALALPRPACWPVQPGEGLRAGFDGPARALRCATALADNLPAAQGGHPHRRVRVARRPAQRARRSRSPATWPGRHSRARRSPPSTVQDLVAGSGIDFDERGALGELRLFSVLRSDDGGVMKVGGQAASLPVLSGAT